MEIFKTIQMRRSVRSFSDAPVDDDKKKAILGHCSDYCTGPFKNRMKFFFTEVKENDLRDLRKLGTYGMISGARLYLVGCLKPGEGAMEDFGFALETAILKCTEIGLGTCWLGGFLSRSAFGERINLEPGWVIPAVTPVGYPVEKMPLKEKVIRRVVNASKRKDFEALFFDGNPGVPLSIHGLGHYKQVLEAVRLAPSASNKQPWRVLKDHDSFHFFLDEDHSYNNKYEGVQLQNIDMGIAMCHFDLTANELGLKGKWEKIDPSAIPETGWKYILTWKIMDHVTGK